MQKFKHEDLYKPHTNQLKLHLDKHKYRVIVAGRRFGKSAFSINEAIVRILGKKRQICWIILPTYKQAKEIYWIDPDVTKYFLPYVQMKVLKKNDSELSLYCPYTESWIRLKGADNPDSLRGSGLDLIIWDEVGKTKPYAFQAISPSLADSPNHRVIYTGTPTGFNHFHDYALMGDRNGAFPQAGKNIALDPNWSSWHFTSYDNMAWPEGSYERQTFVDYLESEKRRMTPDYFNQEYLGLFTRFTGLIYKEFDQLQHVEAFEHKKDAHGDYLFGMDFAVRGWTAALPGIIKPDGHVYLCDAYKKETETAKTHAGAIKTMLDQYATLSKYTGFGDPAGWMKNQQKGDMIWSIADEYLDEGLPLVQANNQVTAGINYVRQLFQEGKIHIHPRCTPLVDELMQYQWKDQPEMQIGVKNQPEEPRKFNDHLVDCLRYMLFSKPVAPDELEKPRTTTFPSQFTLKIDKPPEDEDQYTPIEISSIYD